MSRAVGAIVVACVMLSLVGCQAPMWTQSGPAAYKDKKMNTILFRGYSGVCNTPQEAARRARLDGVARALNYIFEGVRFSDLYTPEARAIAGFGDLEALVRTSISDTLYKAFDDPRLLADHYTRERRDKLEVTFETYYLYEVSRNRLAEIIREAEPVVELHIYKEGPGSTPGDQKKLADDSSQAFDRLAQEPLISW